MFLEHVIQGVVVRLFQLSVLLSKLAHPVRIPHVVVFGNKNRGMLGAIVSHINHLTRDRKELCLTYIVKPMSNRIVGSSLDRVDRCFGNEADNVLDDEVSLCSIFYNDFNQHAIKMRSRYNYHCC